MSAANKPLTPAFDFKEQVCNQPSQFRYRADTLRTYISQLENFNIPDDAKDVQKPRCCALRLVVSILDRLRKPRKEETGASSSEDY
uniref:BHLH domain-containing protein n=1 Tax=Steinernema glaseri TaxID=37863 RepID=A0A1I8A1H3_9BILA